MPTPTSSLPSAPPAATVQPAVDDYTKVYRIDLAAAGATLKEQIQNLCFILKPQYQLRASFVYGTDLVLIFTR
jgi:hypothetical protein